MTTKPTISAIVLTPLFFACATTVSEANHCLAPANEIVAENCLPGAPSTEWDINGYGDPSIQGFGHEIGIAQGETIHFKIDTDSDDYRIDIYRMGYYGGMGARRIDTIEPSATLPQVQPDCLNAPIPVLNEAGAVVTAEAPLFDCGNWAVSASWDTPTDATSGIYFARLVREDPLEGEWWPNDAFAPQDLPLGAEGDPLWDRLRGSSENALVEPRASHIYFIVRDDEGASEMLFQTSDITWQAYNRFGGHSVYGQYNPVRDRLHGGEPRAYKVSYNRPFETRHYRAVNAVFNSEYPMVRWLERNGYDVSYITGVDVERLGDELLEHKVFMAVGHDEYWTGKQRRNVEAARDAGIHLAFFSSNAVFWKVRWEESIDGSGQPYRTLVTYKEPDGATKMDPEPGIWTGTFRDHRSMNPEGPWPENALIGTLFTVNAWRNDPLIADEQFSKLRFWRNTEVANLGPGERFVSIKGMLGHEWDSDMDNNFRPPGLFQVSSTTVTNTYWCGYPAMDACQAASATHNAVMYRHESGALVFGSGTLQWAWGLDANHDTETGVPPERQNGFSTRVGEDPNGPDRNIQQATLNLFADMGVQPTTMQSDLIPATASTDATTPRSSIEFPSEGSPVNGNITIRGSASDSGGGIVAGVEISTDGGATWHPAHGRENWSFEWSPVPDGKSSTLLSRAVDDTGNLETPSPGVSVTLNS